MNAPGKSVVALLFHSHKGADLNLNLVADARAPTPIKSVNKAGLPAWLEANPNAEQWLAPTGFTAEPGSFAFMPDAHGRVERVVTAPLEGEAIWAYAGLPMALPVGAYVLEDVLEPDRASAVALGWALGATRSRATSARSATRPRWCGLRAPIAMKSRASPRRCSWLVT